MNGQTEYEGFLASLLRGKQEKMDRQSGSVKKMNMENVQEETVREGKWCKDFSLKRRRKTKEMQRFFFPKRGEQKETYTRIFP